MAAIFLCLSVLNQTVIVDTLQPSKLISALQLLQEKTKDTSWTANL